MSAYVKKGVEALSVASGFLWPVVCTLEVGDGIYGPAAFALTAAYLFGGQQMFWNAEFRDFIRGYIAGGVIVGGFTYYKLKSYEGAVEGDIAKGEAVYAKGVAFYNKASAAYNSATQWYDNFEACKAAHPFTWPTKCV